MVKPAWYRRLVHSHLTPRLPCASCMKWCVSNSIPLTKSESGLEWIGKRSGVRFDVDDHNQDQTVWSRELNGPTTGECFAYDIHLTNSIV